MITFFKDSRPINRFLLKSAFITTASVLVFWPRPAFGETDMAVVITEIQTAGVSSTDEFVEIYNAGQAAINLAGWRLSKKTASGTESNLLTEMPEFTLAPASFVVIGHPNHSGKSDLQYSTQQSLSDNNTVILYADAGKSVINVVGWGTAGTFNTKAAENPASEKSLQRKFKESDGLELPLITGVDADDFFLASPTAGIPAPQESALPTDDGRGEASPGSVPTTSGPSITPAFTEQVTTKFKIIFNEIFPNPAGADDGEFIELKNMGNSTVDLTFWKIQDNESEFLFEPEEINNRSIGPGQLLVLPRMVTRLAIDNESDSLILSSATGQKIDKIVLSKSPDGASHIRDTTFNLWRWSSLVTAGQENVFKRVSHPPRAKIVVGGLTASSPTIFDGSDSFDQDDNELKFSWMISGGGQKIVREDKIFSLILERAGKYEVSLRVTDPAGHEDVLKKSFTLAPAEQLSTSATPNDPKGTIQSSVGAAAMPTEPTMSPAVNKPLTVNATKTKGTRQNHPTTPPPTPIEVEISELTKHLNQVVKTSGEIVEVKKSSFYLSDTRGEVEVKLNGSSANVLKKGIKLNASGSVTGLVKKSGASIVLQTRSAADLDFSPPIETPATPAKAPSLPWVMPATYGALSVAILAAWKVQKWRVSHTP